MSTWEVAGEAWASPTRLNSRPTTEPTTPTSLARTTGNELGQDIDTNTEAEAPIVTVKAMRELQVRLQSTEAELEKCREELKAVKLEASTARKEAIQKDNLISEISEHLQKTCASFTMDIHLQPPQLDAKGEDRSYLAFKLHAKNKRNSAFPPQLGSEAPPQNLQSTGERIRLLAGILQFENAYLKRRGDSFKASSAAANASLEELEEKTSDTTRLYEDVASIQTQLKGARESTEKVEGVLEKVRKQIDDAGPLIKIGVAIRLRFLQHSKAIMEGLSEDRLDQHIMDKGEEAAFGANEEADAALIKLHGGDKSEIEMQFRALYEDLDA